MKLEWSGQIIIFHQPGISWNKGSSLTKPPFGVRSCEVAIIWPEWYLVYEPIVNPEMLDRPHWVFKSFEFYRDRWFFSSSAVENIWKSAAMLLNSFQHRRFFLKMLISILSGFKSFFTNTIWVFPKIGVPQNGWFIMENPIKMIPLFLETPI